MNDSNLAPVESLLAPRAELPTAPRKVGLVTIGQSPRPDGLAKDIGTMLGEDVHVVERGALDGLSIAEVAEMAPSSSDYRLLTILKDGTTVQIGRSHILHLMQQHIDDLERTEGVEASLVICSGAFPPFDHSRPLLIPQAALYGAVAGMAAHGLLASIMPLPSQQKQSLAKWAEFGVRDVRLYPVSPYAPDRISAIEAAADAASSAGAVALFIDGFAFDQSARLAARRKFDGPVVLSRSLAAKLLVEITE